ncbi:MAG: hypothetical protein K6G80_00500 [Treponema sp.]|nr:hypothetical protein [Treponema sp.]
MKKLKLAFFALSMIMPGALFSEQFQIAEVLYNIEGMTKQYAVELNIPIDKNRIFHTEEEFTLYLADLRQRFNNERVFETSTVDVEKAAEENGITKMNILVHTKDSKHLLPVPYPKYDSNSGLTLKLKVKDMNFLGTMESMSFDVNYKHEKQDDGSYDDIFGINFDYDYPFRLWKLDSSWNNDLSLDFTVGNSKPEFKVKTGFTFTYPFDTYKLVLDLKQTVTRNFDYEDYGDELYFTETAELSAPVKIAAIDSWGDVTWTPYGSYTNNWDRDAIDERNTDLLGPSIEAGHSISTSRINWIGNFRKGLSLEFGNSLAYNYTTQNYTPKIWAEWQGFKAYKYAGICARLYGFAQFNGNTAIGTYLRGIKDSQDYKNLVDDYGDDVSSVKVPVAIVGNFDLPFHIITTDWNGWTEALFGEESKIARALHWMRLFDFELQLAPFADFALTKNLETGRLFSIKDGFYSGGLEMIVYPARWRSIEVRASLGVDAGRKIIKKAVSSLIDTSWRSEVSAMELYIGIGLHY